MFASFSNGGFGVTVFNNYQEKRMKHEHIDIGARGNTLPSSFKLIDTNRYFLEGTRNNFIHIASIGRGLREFVLLLERSTKKVYLNEITGGNLEYIDDDSLYEDLMNFVEEKKLVTIEADKDIKDQPFYVNKA